MPVRTLGTVARAATAAAALVALTACGGNAGSADPPVGEGPSAAASPAPTESASGGSPATPAGDAMPDPCRALTKEEASAAMGVKYTKATMSELAGSKLCGYTLEDTEAPTVSSQTSPATGDLDTIANVIKGQFGSDAEVSKVTVPGAKDARQVSGTISGQMAVDVIAVKEGVVYQVLTVDAGASAQKKTLKLAEAILN